jgi:hypothetical protein
VDVRFVQVDQQMAVALGTGEEILDLLDMPALRIGRAASSSTTIPGDAGRRGSSRGSRSTARAPSRPDGAARWRIGTGYGRRCGGALGGTDRLAEAGLDFRTKIL